MPSEKQFENKVKAFLESKRIYRLGAHKGAARGYYVKRFGGGVYTPAGLPDMQIVIGGTCLEVEIKKSGGVASALQLQKIDQINASGGHGFVLYPEDFEDFKALVENYV